MTFLQFQKLASVLGAVAASIFGGPPIAIDVDGALPITKNATYLLTKGSALALSVAAPGAANVGREITLLGGSDFQHIVTFTGATLWDGTAGGNLTWTTTAVQGCSLTFVAISATKWNVKSFNLGTIST